MSRKRLHHKSSKPTSRSSAKRPQKTPDAAIEFTTLRDGSASITAYSAGAELIDPEALSLGKTLDSEWFRAHPRRSHRLRRAIVGEAPQKVGPNTYIVVRQMMPGYYVRSFFDALVPLPEGDAPEHIAHAFFDLLQEFPGGALHWGELAARMRAYETGWSTEETRGGRPRTVH